MTRTLNVLQLVNAIACLLAVGVSIKNGSADAAWLAAVGGWVAAFWAAINK